MPLTGDFTAFKRLASSFVDLGEPSGKTQKDMARGVVLQVRGVLKEQFAAGEGPYGAWDQTVRGKPALISKKLPQDFRGKPIKGGVRFDSRIKWLRAHHEGYTFAARRIGEGKQFLTFNRKGRLIRNNKALRFVVGEDGNFHAVTRRGVFQTFAKAHKIGKRVLPERTIYPHAGEMPTKWAYRINVGAAAAMAAWHKKARGG